MVAMLFLVARAGKAGRGICGIPRTNDTVRAGDRNWTARSAVFGITAPGPVDDKRCMSQIASLFVQLVVGSARLRALAAGLPIGALARALGESTAGGQMGPALAAAVIVGGTIWVLQFTLERAPCREDAALSRLAEQVVSCVGIGILVAMHLPRLFA